MSQNVRAGGRAPSRPSLTPAFTCGCSLWASCAVAYSLGRSLSAHDCLVITAASFAICLGTLVIAWHARKKASMLVVASLIVGMGLGAGAAAQCHRSLEGLDVASAAESTLILAGDSKASARGEYAFAKLRTGGECVVVRACFEDGFPRLCGQRFSVQGSFKAATFADDEYLWNNGAVGTYTVTDAKPVADVSPFAPLRALRMAAIEAIGSGDDAHALMQALACGYRHGIEQTPLYSSFQRDGLAHLVAVSGAHLVILTGFAAVCLQAMRVPRRLSVGILITIMVAYLAVSGLPISAIRATVMSSVGILALFGKRRPSSLNALGLSILGIVLVSPSASVSVSFTLSVLSTAGIVLFSTLFEAWFSATPLSRVSVVCDALSLTLSASVLSQPYACSVFHQLPVLAPVANVACAPLFPLACGGALTAAVSGALALPGAQAVANVAGVCADVLSNVVALLSSVPYASVPVSVPETVAIPVSVLIGGALWAIWPSMHVKGVSVLACAVAMAFAVYGYAVSLEDCIVMLDVGQGDAFLVRSRGSTMLIDTGNQDAQLIEQLGRSATMKLDAVLVTHFDDDHCGSLDALQKAVHVDRVIMAADALSSTSEKGEHVLSQARNLASDLVGVRVGDSFTVGAFTAQVVWPSRYRSDGGNEDSLCLLVGYDGDADGQQDATALFTGDAESDQLESMLQAGLVGKVDLLKVGHHGSKKGISVKQAEALGPKIALIGVGASNRYGHPSSEVLGILEDVGCKVYRSDLDGQVKCSFSADSIRVSLQ